MGNPVLLAAIVAGLFGLVSVGLSIRATRKAEARANAREVERAERDRQDREQERQEREQAALVVAQTARREMQARIDDIAYDRAVKINELVIEGLRARCDILQDLADWESTRNAVLTQACRDAGISIPPMPPRPIPRQQPT